VTHESDARVLAVVAELRRLAREHVAPAQARARMRALGAGIELVHERDAYGDTYHYDAIVDEPEGVLTVGYAPDRGQPFLLRGAERLADRDLVRVDGQTLKVRDAIALLDFVWNERRLIERLLDVCLIEAELERAPVEPSDAAVQEALDRIRASQGLHSAAATERWMAERGLTHEALERYACEQAAILAVRERSVGAQVAERFAQSRAGYERASFMRLDVPDDEAGRAFVEEVLGTGLDLLAAAGAWMERHPAARPPVVETRCRRELPTVLVKAVFACEPGRLGVGREEGRIVLVHVLALCSARLDEATRERVADELFAEWLAERRARARIEWNWGPSER
jgi:putative peptide maturation system protein